MPVKDSPADSLAVVGEEQAMCRANLSGRVDAKGGRYIFAYGLALDQPFPESIAILDGLVDRARTPTRPHMTDGAERTGKSPSLPDAESTSTRSR